MSVLSKANEAKSVNGDGKSLKDMFVKVEANSSIRIIPLVSFENIDTFSQFNFGSGSGYFTIIDDNEPNHPCTLMGLKSKAKYIMPVMLQTGKDEWTEPMYYSFPSSVYQQFSLIDASIKSKSEEEEDVSLTFKGAILTVIRNDKTANGFVEYTVQWLGDMFSKVKSMRGKPLAESTLDLDLAVAGFSFNDDSEIRPKIIERLIEKSDFRFAANDPNNHLGSTIGERLQSLGLLTNTEQTVNEEWENLGKE